MRHKSSTPGTPVSLSTTSQSRSERLVRDIRRATRKQYSAEEKIRIVLDGLRGEVTIAELCRREGIAESLYYSWSKEFLEAGKRRLAGDTARSATTSEVKDLERQALELKEVVAESPVYTVGHSTRSIAEFVALLQHGQVDLVVDIRSTPRSRTNPQFNLETLPRALSVWQIGHVLIAELGGRRAKSKVVPPEVNGFWANQRFHNYADYALFDDFRVGFLRLTELSREQRCAIMCSEAVWWRCHRRFVADYLLHDGRKVFHLMGTGRVDVATINPAARADGNSLVYPALGAPVS